VCCIFISSDNKQPSACCKSIFTRQYSVSVLSEFMCFKYSFASILNHRLWISQELKMIALIIRISSVEVSLSVMVNVIHTSAFAVMLIDLVV